jgi:flagellin-like hook-associated protein FlgL
MPFAVGLSQGVLANLLALQTTTNQINTVQNQLATGKKVNTALDNPSSFFLANSFQSSISTLNTVLDSISVGQRTLDAANSGISSLTALLNTAKGSLNQALASAPTTSVLTGTAQNLTGSTLLSTLGFAATDVITVSDGTTNSTTFTTSATQTVQALLNFINAGGTSTNNKDRAELAGDGRILLEGATGAAAITITTNSASTTALQNLGFNATATNGTINNTAAATGTTSAARISLAAQFDVLRTQIDQMAADSGYNGVSLLNNQSLTVIMNQSATTKLVVAGINDTSLGLGVVASTNTFQTNFDANTALNNINNALATLQNQASTYTANVAVIQDRTDFTKQTINTLQTGTNDLTLADANQEGASLLALQTRQSLSSTALSLATQADQNVLRLFK